MTFIVLGEDLTPLHELISQRLPAIKGLLIDAGYGKNDVEELTRLFAGLYVLLCFAVDPESFDRKKVNTELQKQMGSGHSWYSSLKFLTGQRAQVIYISRTDVIREIGGSEMVKAFNVILPQVRDLVDAL